MINSLEIDNIIVKTMNIAEDKSTSDIKLNGNGGNSILLICEPHKESHYVESITKLMKVETYQIIDLNQIIVNFVINNKEYIEECFEVLRSSIHQIFKLPDNEEGLDIYHLIIQKIEQSFNEKKIPVLINTGALYGTQIENINIMENKTVMTSNLPLIFLYPATKEFDKLKFLSTRTSSKYRCMVVE